MWLYEKKLQYPVKIKKPNAAFAKIIISQLGGPFCKKVIHIFQSVLHVTKANKKTDYIVRFFIQ